MSSESSKIEHLGVVESIDSEYIRVRITATSACAACHAKGNCSVSEKEDKIIEIPRKEGDDTFAKGQTVKVVLDVKAGLLSVWWAYVLPAVMLLATLLIAVKCGVNEGLAALLALAAVACYYYLLFVARGKIASKTSMYIESIN